MPRVELKRGEAWVQIPEELAEAPALAEVPEETGLDEEELRLLKKLNGIRFAERTKTRLRRELGDSEQRCLGKLMKKGAVQFYEEGKYKEKGVYSITKKYYGLVASKKDFVDKLLGEQRYLVVDSIEKANKIFSGAEEEIRQGNIVSVRGFDKKVYITSQEVMDVVGAKVLSELDSAELTVSEAAKKCGEGEELVKTILEVLRESGDVIEKRDGVYCLA